MMTTTRFNKSSCWAAVCIALWMRLPSGDAAAIWGLERVHQGLDQVLWVGHPGCLHAARCAGAESRPGRKAGREDEGDCPHAACLSLKMSKILSQSFFLNISLSSCPPCPGFASTARSGTSATVQASLTSRRSTWVCYSLLCRLAPTDLSQPPMIGLSHVQR